MPDPLHGTPACERAVLRRAVRTSGAQATAGPCTSTCRRGHMQGTHTRTRAGGQPVPVAGGARTAAPSAGGARSAAPSAGGARPAAPSAGGSEAETRAVDDLEGHVGRDDEAHQEGWTRTAAAATTTVTMAATAVDSTAADSMTMAATTTVAAVAATEELSLRRRGTGRTQQLSGAGGPTRGRLAGQRPRWQAGQARISPADSRGAVALMMLTARGRRCAGARSR